MQVTAFHYSSPGRKGRRKKRTFKSISYDKLKFSPSILALRHWRGLKYFAIGWITERISFWLSPLYIRLNWSWRLFCKISKVVSGFYFLRRNPYILPSMLADMIVYFLPEVLVGNGVQIVANMQSKLLNYSLEESSSSIYTIWSTAVLRLNDMISSVDWRLAYVLTSLGQYFDPRRRH